MRPDAWYDAAVADARRRGLPELEGLLKGLRIATTALRSADFADDASGAPRADRPSAPGAGA